MNFAGSSCSCGVRRAGFAHRTVGAPALRSSTIPGVIHGITRVSQIHVSARAKYGTWVDETAQLLTTPPNRWVAVGSVGQRCLTIPVVVISGPIGGAEPYDQVVLGASNTQWSQIARGVTNQSSQVGR